MRTREENPPLMPLGSNISSLNISVKSYENDLNTYLSQYLAKDENSRDRRPILQEADLNQVSAANNTTMQLINAERANAQKHLFSSKKFTIIGFELNEIEKIKTVIEPFGGLVNNFEATNLSLI